MQDGLKYVHASMGDNMEKKLEANNRAYEDRIETLNQKLDSFKVEIETLKQSKS